MNAALRKVSLAAFLLLLALLVNINVLQAVQPRSLATKPGNTRAIIASYNVQRGYIVVGNTVIATSEPTNDQLRYLRTYPGGPMYAAVTGYATQFTRTGIEAAENGILSGQDDRLFVHRLTNILNGTQQQGGIVRLTINAKVQKAAWDAMQGKVGAAVAIDPSTGAILAMVSTPSYDPSTLALHDTAAVDATMKKLAADPNQPLLNRALAQTYPPGSTFKVITSAAALSSGMTPDTLIDAPHRLPLPLTTLELHNFNDEFCTPSANGKQTLLQALSISCNTAFAKLGLQLGDAALRKQAEAFGFDDNSLDVPIPVAASVFPAVLNQPQTAQSAIGQFDVRMTPLEAAMIAAAVANHGKLERPYLVGSIDSPNLQTISTTQPTDYNKQVVTPQVADELTQMMLAVVQNGTGTSAQIPGVSVAGKTGTAQNAPGHAPHAWFIGFVPGATPHIAVAVIVEAGDAGGNDVTGARVAAPVAKAMIQAALP
ncbi:MAG: penicillin-binding protein [Frankiaceae bacterium]|nr:penicillin-binding protein [Frankiaceae bacterium]